MAESLSRRGLYDLVWSESMRTLAGRFGISDVGLRKTCQRAAVPTPGRGYWARKEAGKKTFVQPFPDRPPGMEDEVLVAKGQSYWYRQWTDEELLGPLPPPPKFDTSLETVRERIVERIGKVPVPRETRLWHPSVERLLKADKARQDKQQASPYGYIWDKPLFESPLDRRRLRLLNALFLAVGKFNGRPSPDKEAKRISISFYEQHIHVGLDVSPRSRRRSGGKTSADFHPDWLTLSILESYGSELAEQSWSDGSGSKLEAQMADIAVRIVLLAEERYRESAQRRYQWRIKRKAELEEEQRRRKLEAERAELERQKRLEQERIDGLLRDAAAYQQALTIREYVQKIERVQSSSPLVSTEDLQRWRAWALSQVDRIDPSLNGSFLAGMRSEES